MNNSLPSEVRKYAQGMVPIVVGVTGHRDVPRADYLALTFASNIVLREIVSQTPNSPHILISCLAEGADRIASRCALELGWTLGVLLPSDSTIYELDFVTQQSKEEYRELLKAAAWVECVDGDGSDKSDYIAAGIRMMQQSQLLIAYWDGKAIGLKGGTGDIVDCFLSEIPDSGQGLSGNTPPDARPVIQVVTRRETDPEYIESDNVGKIEWIPPHPGGMSSDGELDRWREVLRRIDLFNADSNEIRQKNISLVERCRIYLDGEKFDTQSKAFSVVDACGSMFAIADAMSSNAQKERNQIFFRLAGLATAAIVLEQIYSGSFSSPVIIGLAVLSGIVAVFVYKHGVSKRIEDRYLDYRSLAEACRVQHFWMRCGIRASVADNFLLEQRDELEWVRQAIRSNELSINVASLSRSSRIDNFEEIRNLWIEDQRHYFLGTVGRNGGNKADLNKKNNRTWEKRASFLFMSGVFSVMVLAASQLLLVDHFHEVGESLIQYSGIAYGLLFASAGLIKVYQEVNAFSEHSKSYRRGGLLMQRASQRLQGAIKQNDIELAQRIVYETGCEALDENGDWLLLHRDRPVEVPLG